eukprot:9377717-Pyramimonas_sp.AAC.2
MSQRARIQGVPAQAAKHARKKRARRNMHAHSKHGACAHPVAMGVVELHVDARKLPNHCPRLNGGAVCECARADLRAGVHPPRIRQVVRLVQQPLPLGNQSALLTTSLTTGVYHM